MPDFACRNMTSPITLSLIPTKPAKWTRFVSFDYLRTPRGGVNVSSKIVHLTQWGRDKMAVMFFQTTFSDAFSWMKINEFRLKFHWSLFLRVQLTIFHHWFRSWLGAGQATSHYLNQWRLVYWRVFASLGFRASLTSRIDFPMVRIRIYNSGLCGDIITHPCPNSDGVKIWIGNYTPLHYVS